MSRRLDLSKFRGDSDEEDDFPPVKKQIVLDTYKQQTFSHGVQKKTRKELEREEEERKRKEEEEAAAKAYKEFEDWFGADDASSAPLGGTSSRFAASSSSSSKTVGPGGGFVKAGGGDAPGPAYAPTRSIPVGPSRAHPKPSTMRSPSPPTSKPKPKGKRVMDAFLEEIKKEEAHREAKFGKMAKTEGSSISAMAAWETARGSHDIGDPETTNLYISNLPQGINEESLGLFFAKYGPVGAVKIMWPRGDEDTSIGAGITNSRRSKAGLSGFVAYMKRRDAEIAVKELDGLDWGGSIIKVGWSKMVKIPPRAMYETTAVDPALLGAVPVLQVEIVAAVHETAPVPDLALPLGTAPPPAPPPTTTTNVPDPHPHPAPRPANPDAPPSPLQTLTPPAPAHDQEPPPRRKFKPDSQQAAFTHLMKQVSDEREKFVRAVVERVKKHGYEFEDALFDREEKNEKFAFLRKAELPEYHVYRYLLNDRYKLPTPPPPGFGDEGKAEQYSSDSAEESETDRTRRTNKGHLGKMARRRFEAGLRAMSGEREQVARLMEFAMGHADAVDEVADIICQSLVIPETPVPRKLARLHLISDILHNSASSLPNVWRYRMAFETRLPKVMEHFADVYKSLVAFSGKLTGETFKSQAAFVIEVWENWIVFNAELTAKLRSILNGAPINGVSAAQRSSTTKNSNAGGQPTQSSKFKKGGFKSTMVPVAAVAAAPAGDDDLDGEAMDLDGEPVDLDGAAMDLDGEAMDIDGEDIDGEDLDGEAMA